MSAEVASRSHYFSHLSLIRWRTALLAATARRIVSLSVPFPVATPIPAPRSAALFASLSANSLPSTPTCTGIHLMVTFVGWFSDRMARTWSYIKPSTYWPDGLCGFWTAWMAAWLSEKMITSRAVVYVLSGFAAVEFATVLFPPVGRLLSRFVTVCSSLVFASAISMPLSSAAYTVDWDSVPR
ncbi:hypothetical protein ACN42_g1165 [Penicillium freii]|uniref:Uncharacterized protein n=1 Tax=Penicillium freii TaxID=48697 RepID=A0A101MSJ5_PENFR|nr:hypothetical protein ACN42_g1165 [Penicillium freii]